MKNPLSPDERKYAYKLWRHDLVTAAAVLQSSLSSLNDFGEATLDPRSSLYFFMHVFYVGDSMASLAQNNISLQGMVRKVGLEEIALQLQSVFLKMHKHKLDYSIDSNIEFDTNIPLIYTALYNLAKNSLQVLNDRSGLISVNISDYSGEANNLSYQAPSTMPHGEFIRFEVADNGKGFPQDREIKEFLKLGVSTHGGDKGFGLYYVYLVCKYLGSHLSINSKKGDTRIAIYHPVSSSS